MDTLTHWLWFDGRFLGIEWHLWKVVGWAGNLTFFSRFLVQWYATEKHRRVVVPPAFWWLSLVGSLLLFCYALLYKKDSVFIFAYAFNFIPYVRNLMIHHQTSDLLCPHCQAMIAHPIRFCPHCGGGLTGAGGPAPGPDAERRT